MARIRSIKPEFPQSETVGRLSRDARLLFIQLWTIVDDAGRTRAPSRMLASLLYPYDDDAPGLIDGWLTELENAECIRRYEVDGNKYLDIPKWLIHQKIDRPSASKLPAFPDDASIPREDSRAIDADLGPRIMDQEGTGKGEGEGVGTRAPAKSPPVGRATGIQPDWKPKDPEANPAEVKRFVAYNLANGTVMADWDAAWEVWCSRIADYGEAKAPKAQGPPPEPQAWITEDDPRLPDLAARWEREHGRKPRVAGSKNQRGIGAYFPSEWLAQH